MGKRLVDKIRTVRLKQAVFLAGDMSGLELQLTARFMEAKLKQLMGRATRADKLAIRRFIWTAYDEASK